MEHMAWKGRIKPGCKAEYQKRHAEIWPEMVKVLKDAGICNYSIFYCNDELFGYYECEKGVAYAEKVQAESPVVDRWNEYMKDILELEMDPVTGAQPKLEQAVIELAQRVGADLGHVQNARLDQLDHGRLGTQHETLRQLFVAILG